MSVYPGSHCPGPANSSDNLGAAVQTTCPHAGHMPLGFEIIPEADEIGGDFRHVLFGTYRIIYHVAQREVVVLGVIHAGRKLKPALLDLPHPPEK